MQACRGPGDRSSSMVSGARIRFYDFRHMTAIPHPRAVSSRAGWIHIPPRTAMFTMTAGVNLKTLLSVALCLLFLFVVQPAHAARNIPVPARCTPAVNQGLADLIASGARRGVDNIMACGVAIERTRIHRGGPHGDHHITTISAALPSGRS